MVIFSAVVKARPCKTKIRPAHSLVELLQQTVKKGNAKEVELHEFDADEN